jgi:hypothetical protein
MPGTPPKRPLSYERALRVIGRHLDAEPAYHTSVLEVPDGFTVRSQPVRHRASGKVVHFDWQRLIDMAVVYTASRNFGKKVQPHSGIWASFPNGHEDFFRALGYLLDSQGAANVSVDELPDGFAVSYVRDDGRRAFEKCHRVYRREEIAELLHGAVARRGGGGSRATA